MEKYSVSRVLLICDKKNIEKAGCLLFKSQFRYFQEIDWFMEFSVEKIWNYSRLVNKRVE